MFLRRIVMLMAAAGLVAAMAVPAHATNRDIARGSFVTLPGGAELGYDISGRALMIRSTIDGGATRVVVRATGLAPNTTYPTHVHNAPCSATPPGGTHYQEVVGGPVDAVNEIWPSVTTNNVGRGVGSAVHGFWARQDAQSIVIHYPLDTSIRLACLDLH